MVDTGIDYLVDVGEGNYKEIQIKSREDTAIFTTRIFKPSDRRYVICSVNSKHGGFLWVFPSGVYSDNATRTKSKKGKEYLQLRIGAEGSPSFEKFREYRDNYQKLLTGATPEVRKTVQKASPRVEGKHLSQGNFEIAILRLLAERAGPIGRKEIISDLKERLKSEFSKADLELLKNGKPRWENTARWAISHLGAQEILERRGKNQWVISNKAREAVGRSSPESNAPTGIIRNLEYIKNRIKESFQLYRRGSSPPDSIELALVPPIVNTGFGDEPLNILSESDVLYGLRTLVNEGEVSVKGGRVWFNPDQYRS
jgi:hypothetical protein